MAETAKHPPDTTGAVWKRQEEAATLCGDAAAGPLHMRTKPEYLPQFPRESAQAYKDRLATSVFYDAFARTVDGLTGMVFRKPPKIADEVPSQIRALWENIDGQGTHAEVFLRERHRDGEIDGHFVIFVDMERVDPEKVRSKAQAKQVGLRPFWTPLRKQDIVGFRTATVGGETRVVHLRYVENVTEQEGEYGERIVKRVREYNLAQEGERLVQFIIHAYRTGADGKTAWVVDDEGVMSIDEIPIAVGYIGERRGVLETVPPHLSLALENVKHYQLVSDNDHTLHIASVPILAVYGPSEESGEKEVAPNSAWVFDRPYTESRLEYVEPEGNGLEAMERRIEKSEHRMAVLGLSTLMNETKQAETATSKRISKAESDSALASHARATQDAAEEAIRLTAKWMGLDANLPDKGTARWVAMNSDFEHLPLDAQTVNALATMVANGALTQETMWSVLQRGKLLPDDFDAEAESELLSAAGLVAPRGGAMDDDPDARIDA